jgi:hypothetical protein
VSIREVIEWHEAVMIWRDIVVWQGNGCHVDDREPAPL